VELVHPEEGLRCPEGHESPSGQAPHTGRERAPVVSYRCRECGAVFNAFTGTVLSGIRHRPSVIVMILRGFAQGVPTQHLADELDLDYSGAQLEWRHRLQASALESHLPEKLSDTEAEADELFQNAGEKGQTRPECEDSPRRRANKKGTGTFENDRPPVHGVAGRGSGKVRLSVCRDTKQPTIEKEMSAKLASGGRLCTDESHAYNHMNERGYEHLSVCHGDGEYGRDEDDDGFCEIHSNTMEGIWTGLRNFLRPFRGVSKSYLAQYVAVFELSYNHSGRFWALLRAMLLPDFTCSPT
jgi:transposase-like protein